MIKLGSIADIRMGATLRGRDATRPVPNGRFRLVRIGDLTQDGQWITDQFDRISPCESISPELLLRPGDVLFPNRGARTTACVFRFGYEDALAGAQFFLLRPDDQVLLPEFLAWYLRSQEAARHFDERRTGTHVKIIQREALTELNMPLPPLKVQGQIVELSQLQVTERDLTAAIAELKTRLLNHQLIQTAKSLKTSFPR
jgi:restriction endonuclease S subunit